MVYQQTDGLADALATGQVSAYVGFDPTASSLHIGNLVPVMGSPISSARTSPWRSSAGNRNDRRSERQDLGAPADFQDEIESNAKSIESSSRISDFSGANAARMRNNATWLRPLKAVEFMRDVGKHFTVNYMLAKESVQARIEGGISFTEFSYMLLQAYDYLELCRREGVTLQIGGSDQSMVAGPQRDDVVVMRVRPNVAHTYAPYVRLAPPSTRIV